MVPTRMSAKRRHTPKQIWFIPSHGVKAKPAITTSSFRSTFDQFLENTSLHGLRYVGDRTLTWFERFENTIFHAISSQLFVAFLITILTNYAFKHRIFFLLIFLLVLSLAGIFMTSAYTKWTTSTIVTMTPDQIPISELPFPGM